MRLREVVAERAKKRGEDKDKSPSRPGRTPPEDDAEKRYARSNTECKRGQRDPRCNPDADEPGECEENEGVLPCRNSITV